MRRVIFGFADKRFEVGITPNRLRLRSLLASPRFEFNNELPLWRFHMLFNLINPHTHADQRSRAPVAELYIVLSLGSIDY
jgi:hypothetical protein